MKVLAVIPARGGSKGIPRKNVRLMNGKPLIAYAIGNALACPAVTDVAVSSDDEEILSVAAKYGAIALERGAELARDAVTLDPVIYDAMLQMENRRGERYDAVITLQPTSPLLSSQTLNQAVEAFLAGDCDTFISAVNQPHLAWSKNENGFFPLYKERLNRQQLPPNLLEAGAFFLSRRDCVTESTRIGKRVSVYEIPADEAVDIDSEDDWLICESRLKSKTVVIRCDGDRRQGMGHIYRGITLAHHLMGHRVIFVTRAACREGLEKIQNSFYPYHTAESDEEFFALLRDIRPDVVVNDRLDTEREYIKTLKTLVPRVVTFEDLGEGALYADAVINALRENKHERQNQYYGAAYVDLRDEFLAATPSPVRETVHKVFVMFGGADASDLTGRVYRLAKKYVDRRPTLQFTFVVGTGYDCAAHGVVDVPGITVHQEVRRVSDLMEGADLAFTSQGRTVFELASMGVPSIVLAQNEREQTHTFAQMQNGFLNLGLGKEVGDGTIDKTFEWLCTAYEVRKDMSRLMQKTNLRAGIDTVMKIILGE